MGNGSASFLHNDPFQWDSGLESCILGAGDRGCYPSLVKPRLSWLAAGFGDDFGNIAMSLCELGT